MPKESGALNQVTIGFNNWVTLIETVDCFMLEREVGQGSKEGPFFL